MMSLSVAKRIQRAARPTTPVRRLYCTCCGGSFQGRQFHNQDTGYGMGECCADRVLAHRPFGHEPMSPAEFERTYGTRGVHFAIPVVPAFRELAYDYTNQAWIVNGVYQSCGHPKPCTCFGTVHAGEKPQANADIH